jgi:hypothetical protein
VRRFEPATAERSLARSTSEYFQKGELADLSVRTNGLQRDTTTCRVVNRLGILNNEPWPSIRIRFKRRRTMWRYLSLVRIANTSGRLHDIGAYPIKVFFDEAKQTSLWDKDLFRTWRGPGLGYREIDTKTGIEKGLP